ncbi:MAG: GNAT family N-acetyltransferase [Pseudomonadota bacterium]
MDTQPAPGQPILATMREEHLDAAYALSSAERWPQRREDWAFALSLGRGTVALEGSRVVGTTIWWAYGPSLALFGMVVVDPAFRGRKIARRLMEKAMAEAGSRVGALVATDDGLPLYERLGFRETDRIHQHRGTASIVARPPGIRAVGRSEDITDVLALDGDASGGDRSAVIAALRNVGKLVIVEQAGRIAGYTVIRRFGLGQVIGPVVARDRENAQALITAGLSDLAGSLVRIDVPESAGLGDWLTTLGLGRVGGGIAMARGSIATPARSGAHLFALASQALG